MNDIDYLTYNNDLVIRACRAYKKIINQAIESHGLDALCQQLGIPEQEFVRRKNGNVAELKNLAEKIVRLQGEQKR